MTSVMGERKLTKAQRRWLTKLGTLHVDACFTQEMIDRGHQEIPLFRARLRSVPCPTCGHPSDEEPMDWDVIDALAAAGMVAERIARSGYFYITDAGRSALEASK